MRIIPLRGMQERSLERLEPRDSRPLPVIQETGAVDQKVAPVFNGRPARLIEDLNLPHALVFEPLRVGDDVLRLDVVFELLVFRRLQKILIDLRPDSVEQTPIWIQSPQELIDV